MHNFVVESIQNGFRPSRRRRLETRSFHVSKMAPGNISPFGGEDFLLVRGAGHAHQFDKGERTLHLAERRPQGFLSVEDAQVFNK